MGVSVPLRIGSHARSKNTQSSFPHPSFEKVELTDERTLTITYSKDRANAGQVLSAVQASGLSIVDVVTRDPDLEDVFLHLTAAA